MQGSLHDSKTDVWCGVSEDGIIGPLFFLGTIKTERYVGQTLGPLLNSHQIKYTGMQS
jgi:hypothetical protein